MPERLVTALAQRGSPLLAALFKPHDPAAAAASPSHDDGKKGGGRGRRGSLVADTVASQFRRQLQDLMEAVGRTEVRYVRCLKPNTVGGWVGPHTRF